MWYGIILFNIRRKQQQNDNISIEYKNAKR